MLKVYLAGEIHTNWREEIIENCKKENLDIQFSSPVTDHASSDDCGVEILGAERANAIGVYKVNDLSNPELVTILPTGIGPEGLVAIPERNLFISANEVDKEKSVTIYSLD